LQIDIKQLQIRDQRIVRQDISQKIDIEYNTIEVFVKNRLNTTEIFIVHPEIPLEGIGY
jgi:hypothetical protein